MGIRRALLIFLSLAFTACAQMTVERGDSARPNVPREYHSDALFWGIWHVEKLPDETQACPQGGIYSIEFRMSPTDVALTAITLGIYVPHRAVYICNKAP